MKVLFAVSNESISEGIVKQYQKEYKEILSYKNVYYFNAILKEIQKDKTYDRIIISEELEPFASNNYEAIDKFLFEKLDNISDEAQDSNGQETSIIFICTDRRTKGSSFLVKLFSIGVYNALLGNDRVKSEVCKLINKPRIKKEAKMYYKIDAEDAKYNQSNEKEVSELEIQNIRSHFKKLGKNTERYADSFNNIAMQYTDEQLKIIINCLPIEVKAVLEEESPKYQEMMSASGGIRGVRNNTERNKEEERRTGIRMDLIDSVSNKIDKPIIIPSSVKKVKPSVKSDDVTGSKVIPTPKKVEDDDDIIDEDDFIEMEKLNRQPVKNNVVRHTNTVQNPSVKSQTPNASQVSKPNTVKPVVNKVQKEEPILPGFDEEDEILPGFEDVVDDEIPMTDFENVEDDEIVLPQFNDVIDDDAFSLPDLEEDEEEELPKVEEKEDLKINNTFEIEEDDTQEISNEKRGRGRPRKTPIDMTPKPKGKRGRPRKVAIGDENILPGFDEEEEKISLPGFDDEIEEDTLPGFENEEEEILPGFEDEEEEIVPEFEDEEEEVLPGFEDEEEEVLPGFEDEEEEIVPEFEDEEEEVLPGFEDEEEEALPRFEDEEEEVLPGFEDEEEEVLPGFEDEEEESLPGFEDEEEESLPGFEDEKEEILPGFEDVEEYTEEVSLPDLDELDDLDDTDEILPGMDIEPIDDEESIIPGLEYNNSKPVSEIEETVLPGMGFEDEVVNNTPKAEYNIPNNYEQYTNKNETNAVVESVKSKVDYSMSSLNSLLTKEKKIVAFLGTTKNGTSFLINHLGLLFSSLGINTAILDMTKNKNSYYIYTKNEEELRKIAYTSISKLQNGYVEGIRANKNLTVYTALPNDGKDYSNAEPILSTLVQNYSLILIDCDFDTDPSYFVSCQELYLVQSMDILTIQPLTAFLKDLKGKGVLEPEKIRVVVNKEIKVRGLTSKLIITGMSSYNDPSMSYMTELFNKDAVKHCVIPFDENACSKYMENVAKGTDLTLNGYSKPFVRNLRNLGDMVYPLTSKQTYEKKSAPVNQDYSASAFSNSMNNTLNQMRKKY